MQEGEQKDNNDTKRHTKTEGVRGKRQQYKTPPVRSTRNEGKGFTPQSPPDEVAHWVTLLSTCGQTARKTATWTKTDRQTD